MLTVKTYLDKSPIHGIGLFADEDISKGTVIWKYHGLTVHKLAIDIIHGGWNHPQSFIDHIKTYAWIENGFYYWCLDNGRFMNHSDNSNTYETKIETIALVDIKKGEEITCNYNTFCEEGANFNL
jgi:SET domain-containing protein